MDLRKRYYLRLRWKLKQTLQVVNVHAVKWSPITNELCPMLALGTQLLRSWNLKTKYARRPDGGAITGC